MRSVEPFLHLHKQRLFPQQPLFVFVYLITQQKGESRREARLCYLYKDRYRLRRVCKAICSMAFLAEAFKLVMRITSFGWISCSM